MFHVYDAITGEDIYQSEHAEDCVEMIAQKEHTERFHLIFGDKPPVWNIDGGLNQLAEEDCRMFLESEAQDYGLDADEVISNTELFDKIVSHYRGYMDVDLNDGCGENFDYAMKDALKEDDDDIIPLF